MARVMFDIDGVLRDFATSWRKKWEHRFGWYPAPSTHWEYLEEVGKAEGIDKDAMRHLIFREWGYEIMSTAPAYPDAYHVVSELQKLGHYIVFATAQNTPETKRGTLVWIADMGLLPDEIIFTGDKTEISADFYIEDRHTTLEKLIEHRPNSIVVGIYRPWNSVYSIPGVIPITSIRQYLGVIQARGR